MADEGALCLSCLGVAAPLGHHGPSPKRAATRTGTRPPPIPPSTPCPYNTGFAAPLGHHGPSPKRAATRTSTRPPPIPPLSLQDGSDAPFTPYPDRTGAPACCRE